MCPTLLETRYFQIQNPILWLIMLKAWENNKNGVSKKVLRFKEGTIEYYVREVKFSSCPKNG